MAYTGRITGLGKDYATGQFEMAVRFNEDVSGLYEKYKDCELSIDIKKYRKRRSLSSNNYAWLLIGKIADTINQEKENVYVEMLKRYGQTATDIDGHPVIFSAKEEINVSNWYKYVTEIGDGYINSKRFIHYRGLKGSSEYDSSEMKIFLDGIVSECKEMEIETETPENIERMHQLWKNNGKR